MFPSTEIGKPRTLVDDIKILDPNAAAVADADLSKINFELLQNYPNPFNPKTNLGFRIADFGFVSLKVFDVLGNEVAILVNEEKPAGKYEIIFNGKDLSSGVYFYKLRAGDYVQIRKMILLK